MANATHVDIRMYGTGTGDCFVLKFYAETTIIFTMMIDGGTWSGTKTHLRKYVKDLKKHVDNKIDLLVITHEHKDHVYLFNACADLFTNDFDVSEIWMSWSEDDKDSNVKQWKEKYGKKKMALAMASDKIEQAFSGNKLTKHLANSFNAKQLETSYQNFALSLNDFKDLHFSADATKKYAGGLKGMENIKNKIANNNIKYFKPGDMPSLANLPGIKFHVLGPPVSSEAIKKIHGKSGTEEAYEHNKVLRRSDSFAAAITDQEISIGQSPFDSKYHIKSGKIKKQYNDPLDAWRQIDYDWLLNGAGNLALRVTKGINNLSLAMAIEFEDSGKVMLFPGDAEIGSWESWHTIDWGKSGTNGKHLTEDLLNRTHFYKVAHHLSHNGTAKEKGLKMMTAPDMVAMATLDFEVISSNWMSTMPNRGILKDLLDKTKGRLIIMNESKMFYDFEEAESITDKIKKERLRLNVSETKDFKKNYKETALYKQYRFHGV